MVGMGACESGTFEYTCVIRLSRARCFAPSLIYMGRTCSATTFRTGDGTQFLDHWLRRRTHVIAGSPSGRLLPRRLPPGPGEEVRNALFRPLGSPPALGSPSALTHGQVPPIATCQLDLAGPHVLCCSGGCSPATSSNRPQGDRAWIFATTFEYCARIGCYSYAQC